MEPVLSKTYQETRELQLDPLAELTMTYTADGFIELKNDIQAHGQLVPIILRNGKVLDGRHRQKVCIELGIGTSYREVGNISQKDAIDIIISNSINKATNTDAAKIEAYLMCKAKGIKQKYMPQKFPRLSINTVNKISFVDKVNPSYLQSLLQQESIQLLNRETKNYELCSTVNSVWNLLKSNKAYDNAANSVDPAPASNIAQIYNTYVADYLEFDPVAEQYFWDLYTEIKDPNSAVHPDSVLGRKLLELVKTKFVPA